MLVRWNLCVEACCRLLNYYNCKVPAIFRLAVVHTTGTYIYLLAKSRKGSKDSQIEGGEEKPRPYFLELLRRRLPFVSVCLSPPPSLSLSLSLSRSLSLSLSLSPPFLSTSFSPSRVHLPCMLTLKISCTIN